MGTLVIAKPSSYIVNYSLNFKLPPPPHWMVQDCLPNFSCNWSSWSFGHCWVELSVPGLQFLLFPHTAINPDLPAHYIWQRINEHWLVSNRIRVSDYTIEFRTVSASSGQNISALQDAYLHGSYVCPFLLSELVFFVEKNDKSLWTCIDYRRLNDSTIKNLYPLLLISSVFDLLQDAKSFSKLDLRNAYHLVGIREEDEWKTV